MVADSTAVIEENGPKNKFAKLAFHSCDVKAQYHIENSEIDKFVNNIVENNLEKILSNKMWDRILNRIEEGID